MRRLEPLLPSLLDPAQHAMYEAVLASPRARGVGRRIILRDDETVTGPFDAWLRSPVVGSLLERAGMALRSDLALTADVRECAILVVADAWGATFEWDVHAFAARAAGVSDATIAAIRTRHEVGDAAMPVAQAIAVARALVFERSVSDSAYSEAVAVLGEQALVEVVMTVGFYLLVSATLETFRPPHVDLAARLGGQ